MTDKQSRYDKYFMDIAIRTAENSYAIRTRVGSVLVKENHILANGWNGRVSGLPNICEELRCQSCNEDRLTDESVKNIDPEDLKTRADVVHAEVNMIYFCAKHGIKTDGTTLYITLSPCATCALAIILAGIKRVVYHERYRDDFGILILELSGVKVDQL